MNTKKTNRDEVRKYSFPVKANKTEREAYIEAANKAGISRGAWVRMVLNEKLGINK